MYNKEFENHHKMKKLWHYQLIRKDYICKFDILEPASGSRGGGPIGCTSRGCTGVSPPPSLRHWKDLNLLKLSLSSQHSSDWRLIVLFVYLWHVIYVNEMFYLKSFSIIAFPLFELPSIKLKMLEMSQSLYIQWDP